MKKVYIKILIIFMFALMIVIPDIAFAGTTDMPGMIDSMSGVSEVSQTSGKISQVMNGIIKLIQYTGTGISVITVTILGTKYMIASPNDKADIKKAGLPVVIGCFILFAAVNLVGVIADIGVAMNGKAGAEDDAEEDAEGIVFIEKIDFNNEILI